MKMKLSRLVSLLCLAATLATCLIMLPTTVLAADMAYSYKDATVGPGKGGDYVSYFGGGIVKASLPDLIKTTKVSDEADALTYYDTYFKQFETSEFPDGLDNTEAEGYAEAYEACASALLTPVKVLTSHVTKDISPDEFANDAFTAKGAGMWFHIDLYFDDNYAPSRQPASNSNILRFNKAGGFYLTISGKDENSVYQTRTLTPYKMTGENVVIENDGWNRISVFFSQETAVEKTVANGQTIYTMGETTYSMTIFINGEGGTTWTPTTATAIPLYTVTAFDESTGEITAENATWSNGFEMYFDTYRANDIQRRLTRFGPRSAEVGTIDDLSIKPLTYELENGLALPTETVNPLDEQIIPSGNTFIPVAASNGEIAYVCDAKDVKNYYDAAKDLALPTPTVPAGRYFVGWVDSEGNPVTTKETETLASTGILKAVCADEYTLTVSNRGNTYELPTLCGNITLGNEAKFWLVGNEIKAAGESIRLTEDTTVYAMAPTLLSGASARASTNSGLRFETKVDVGLHDALGGCFIVGTLIIPTDLLGETEFTKIALDAAGKKYLDLSADVLTGEKGTAYDGDGNLDFYASIVNILAQNYTRKFSAISYIEYEGVRYYSDYNETDNSRSVYAVAVMSDQAKPNEDYSETVRGFINGVVIIENGEQLEAYEGYAHPLSASIADGILTITGENLTEDALKTVIYNGRTFTSGWIFADGKFSAKLPE